MKTLFRFALLPAAFLLSPLFSSGPARAQVTVTVDATLDVHPISPRIYGMNFASAAQVSAGKIPFNRWGGNSTSRYNYQIDVTNTGNDYFFENVAGCWNQADKYCATPPMNPREQSGINSFLSGAAQLQMDTLVTIPTIGWVAKTAKYGHPFDCGCPKSANPMQDAFDPYDTNCGNGKWKGAWINCPPATGTSTAIDPAFAAGWVTYLNGKFGPSNGHRIYALDNEPNLWSSTHHDVHPARLTYDELWTRMRDYGAAIVAVDPTAEIAGPAEWGWPNYFCSDADDISKGCTAKSPDRANHNGVELVAWLLDQANAYEKQNGKRILHYLDLHYYPQGGNPPANTRSLWDPTYTDPSWINDKIALLPRMRDWVNQHYPGTKLLISEWDFYHHNEAAGAVGYAEVLGLFGKYGLDGATAWSPPGVNEAAFGGFKLYRNFDGNGAAFESTSVRATVVGNGVMAFAAVGTSRATIALVNESGQPQMVTVKLAGFKAGATAQWFTGNGATIAKQPDQTVQNDAVSVQVPALSFGMLAIDGQGPAAPDMAMAGPVDLAMSGMDAAANTGMDGAANTGMDGAANTGMDAGARSGTASGGCGCHVGAHPIEAHDLIAPLCLLLSVIGLALRNRRRT